MSLQSATADAQSAKTRLTKMQADVTAFPSALAAKEQERVQAQELAQVC